MLSFADNVEVQTPYASWLSELGVVESEGADGFGGSVGLCVKARVLPSIVSDRWCCKSMSVTVSGLLPKQPCYGSI